MLDFEIPQNSAHPFFTFGVETKKNKENLRSPLVAGEGIEPPAFGL